MQGSDKKDEEAMVATQQLPLHTHETSGWVLEPLQKMPRDLGHQQKISQIVEGRWLLLHFCFPHLKQYVHNKIHPEKPSKCSFLLSSLGSTGNHLNMMEIDTEYQSAICNTHTDTHTQNP